MMKKPVFLALIILLLAAGCVPMQSAASQVQTNLVSNPSPTRTAAPTSAAGAASAATQMATAANNQPADSIAATAPTAAPTAAAAPAATAAPTEAGKVNAAPPAAANGKIPNFDHIIMIVFENHGYSQVIGNPQMPKLNALAKQNVLLSKSYAVGHPSLPNYIAMLSGSTQGITKDCKDCFVNQKSLPDLIEASGRTWKTYQEDMPSACFMGDAKLYVQKHNPFIYFDPIRTNAARCSRSIVPLTALDSDLAANQLPNFAFIMPNLCNSAHDCGLDVADKWIGSMVSKLQASPALGKNYLIVVTFDEGEGKDAASLNGAGGAGGQIATVLISPQAKASFNDPTPVSQYGLLKTILLAWGLPDLGNTSQADTQPITAPWN